jgi:hypothetical protein
MCMYPKGVQVVACGRLAASGCCTLSPAAHSGTDQITAQGSASASALEEQTLEYKCTDKHNSIMACSANMYAAADVGQDHVGHRVEHVTADVAL